MSGWWGYERVPENLRRLGEGTGQRVKRGGHHRIPLACQHACLHSGAHWNLTRNLWNKFQKRVQNCQFWKTKVGTIDCEGRPLVASIHGLAHTSALEAGFHTQHSHAFFMSHWKPFYQKEVIPELQKKLGIKNVMQVPCIRKITLKAWEFQFTKYYRNTYLVTGKSLSEGLIFGI